MSAEHDDGHRLYEEYAVRHVMGGLEESEAQVFRSHLLDCAHCRMRVGELRSIASELADVERAERREKAARALETKERDLEPSDDGPRAHPSPRSRGVALIVGIALIAVLSVWNFVLRGQNTSLDAALRAEQQAASIINFGDAWTNHAEAAGTDGVVRVQGRDLALMIEGTDDDADYEVTLYDDGGAELQNDAVESHGGRLRFLTRRVPAAARGVDVTQPSGGGATVILRAAPAPRTD